MKLIQVQAQLDATDRAVLAALRELPGLAITGHKVGGVKADAGVKVRDADVIVLSPRGVLVVEGKGSYGKRGRLSWELNAPWSIGGDPAAFPSPERPNDQVRLVAQILKKQLGPACPRGLYVAEAVVVVGDGVTFDADPEEMYAGAWVCSDTALPQVVGMLRSPVSLPAAAAMLRRLRLDPRLVPTDAELRAAGFTTPVPPRPPMVRHTPAEMDALEARLAVARARIDPGVPPEPSWGSPRPAPFASPCRLFSEWAAAGAADYGEWYAAYDFDALVDPSLAAVPAPPPVPAPSGECPQEQDVWLAACRQLAASFAALRDLPAADLELATRRVREVLAWRMNLYDADGWKSARGTDPSPAYRAMCTERERVWRRQLLTAARRGRFSADGRVLVDPPCYARPADGGRSEAVWRRVLRPAAAGSRS